MWNDNIEVHQKIIKKVNDKALKRAPEDYLERMKPTAKLGSSSNFDN